MQLVVCAACARHVRDSETSCPFCSVALDARPTRPSVDVRGVSRAAMLLLSAGAVGCGTKAPDPPSVAPMYGGPEPAPSVSNTPQPSASGVPEGPPDVSAAPLYGEAPPATVDDSGMAPKYGAPPPPSDP